MSQTTPNLTELGWTPNLERAALAEGWVIHSFLGSMLLVNGVGISADQAADTVMQGEAEHHKVARQIVYQHSPDEWARLLTRDLVRKVGTFDPNEVQA